VFEKLLLNDVKFIRGGYTLYGLNAGALRLNTQDQAGTDEFTIKDH
jgi:hypothetical protein